MIFKDKKNMNDIKYVKPKEASHEKVKIIKNKIDFIQKYF